MRLVDHEIRDSSVGITPEPMDAQRQPASIDVQLGTVFRRQTEHRHTIDPRNQRSIDDAFHELTIGEGEYIALRPGEFVLAETLQHFTIPNGYCVQLDGTSTLARCGISVHATAGFCDPGFQGTITLEIKNLGNARVLLYAGGKIGQVFVYRLTESERVYGQCGNHYQRQTGAQGARVDGLEND